MRGALGRRSASAELVALLVLGATARAAQAEPEVTPPPAPPASPAQSNPASEPGPAPAPSAASGAPSEPTAAPAASPTAEGEPPREVVVRGVGWASPRGLGDIRVEREWLQASPRQQTSEMLSAAPGFFVDHEDGEGFGNDVFLRGFDLSHGSGIEMRIGSTPINIPLHIQGQGYADANFIIPEVVRSVRVLEGPYDPRQGDSAIVGSAYFELGVPERGYQVRSTYGSFQQTRVVAIAAPDEANDDTFAAFSWRRTGGFGMNRSGLSGTVNAQYAFDLGPRDSVRLLATAYGARSSLAGVVRQDDVDAGRIGLYDTYPFFAEGQGVQSARVILAASIEHDAGGGAHFEFAPWMMWTGFRARQNFAGNLESSQIDPALSGLGDLFETTNRETAAGVTSHFRTAPFSLVRGIEAVAEPGIYLRAGHAEQTKSLLEPSNQQPWDRRIDAGVDSLDAGAYADLDLRILGSLRIAGGPRADLLWVSARDRLANVVPAGTAPTGALPGAVREAAGIVVGAHVTAEYKITTAIAAGVSYGEGFRSLAAERLTDGSTQPYSRVRSYETGLRLSAPHDRYTARLALFETRVANELVFEATAGGLETQNASVRRGFVGSVLARPLDWLLASLAFSSTTAVFATRVPGVSHYVPDVPSALLRGDLTARGSLATVRGKPLTGRVGVGYTFLAGRHLTDTIVGHANHVLNAGAALRYDRVEIGFDAYNLLDLRYADDEQVFVSNWSLRPGQQPASSATHITAAPPRTVLGTIALYF